MPFSEGDKAIIRDVAAKFISDKKLQTQDMCKEKMGTMDKTVKSVNNKLWAIIVMLLGLLGTVAMKAI